MKTDKGMNWDEEAGVGFLDVKLSIDQNPYDTNYFDKYVGYASSQMGQKLDGFRADLVHQHQGGMPVVDVGIGSGNFIEIHGPGAFGYDINPKAILWLALRRLWWDPWQFMMPSATFWDSLEHFADPSAILARVKNFAFISIPIFRNLEHAKNSKHFRPDEHYWYFTHRGLCRFMQSRGFHLIDESDMETKLGREDIHTFVFRRTV